MSSVKGEGKNSLLFLLHSSLTQTGILPSSIDNTDEGEESPTILIPYLLFT